MDPITKQIIDCQNVKKKNWLNAIVSLVVMMLPYGVLAKGMSASVDVPLQYTGTKEKGKMTCTGGGLVGRMNCVTEMIEGTANGAATSTADLELNITPYMLAPGFERVYKIENLNQDITVYLELRGKEINGDKRVRS